KIHDRTPQEEVVKRAADAEIVRTNKAPVTRESILSLPKLKYIGVLATGYNIVNTAAARERDILVTNVPTYGTRSVAQHTFALLLELTQHAGKVFWKADQLGEQCRSEEHTSELQSPCNLVCRLLLEKKKKTKHQLY